MYIKSLYIEQFGMLSSLRTELCPGLNIIEGCNETGKSTIAAFIKFMFYGLSSAEREKYIPWGKTSCGGNMTVVFEGRQYQIERELLLVKGGAKENVSITDEEHTPVFKDSTPDRVFLGVPERVFVSSAYVSELTGTYVEGRRLTDAVENLLFSADEELNTAKALKKIDEERVSLLYKNKKGGEIYELEKSIAECEIKLSEAQQTNSEIFKTEERIASDRAKREENNTAAEQIRARLDEYSAYFAIAMKEKCTDAKKAAEASRLTYEQSLEKCTENGQAPSEEYVSELKRLQAELNELQAELSESEQALVGAESSLRVSGESAELLDLLNESGGEEAVLSSLQHHEQEQKRFRKIGLGLMIAGLLSILAGVILTFMHYNAVGACCSAFGVLLDMFAYSFSHKSRNARDEIRKLAEPFGCTDIRELTELIERVKQEEETITKKREDIENAGSRCEALRERIEQKKAEAVEITSHYRKTEPNADLLGLEAERVGQLLKLLATLESEYKKDEALYESLLEKTSGINTDEQKSRIKGILKTDELAAFKEDEQKHRLAFLLSSIQTLDERILDDEKKLSALTASAKDSVTLYDTLEFMKNKLAEKKKRHDALLLAYDALKAASDSLRGSISPKLARESAAYMSLITDGKYNGVGVDGEYAVSVTDGSSTHSAEAYSTGTRDSAYISLRLALVNTLYRKSTPPLMFDDSFAHIDTERLKRILALLSSVGTPERLQSIIFTCGVREGEICVAIPETNIIRIKK